MKAWEAKEISNQKCPYRNHPRVQRAFKRALKLVETTIKKNKGDKDCLFNCNFGYKWDLQHDYFDALVKLLTDEGYRVYYRFPHDTLCINWDL